MLLRTGINGVVVVVGTVANAHMTWAPLGRKLTCIDSDEADERWLPGTVPYPPAVRWPWGLTQPQAPNSWDSLTTSASTGGGCPFSRRAVSSEDFSL